VEQPRAGLADYGRMPKLENDALMWDEQPTAPGGDKILRPVSDPFSADGGMRLLQGNLGRCIMKTSAVDPSRWTVEAPCRVFSDQDKVIQAFKTGELDRDVVVVVRFQGPRANGMPELHKLTPPLGVLQDKGFKVALVTDGRMSGASGKVPAAIHLSPEALGGGPIGKLVDGDVVRVCAVRGSLEALVEPVQWAARAQADAPPSPYDTGRELFALFRANSDLAEAGASPILWAMENEQ
jgi:phosphogluconate dehydratase